jgi:glycosyltransferase involved in cell wall biosynthesis
MGDGLTNNRDEVAVSVIIPFFNRQDFLAEAIESVLSQTFRDWELVLVDDGSRDDSAKIARAYVARYPDRIFVYAHENAVHRGASSSRRLGVKFARGKFITFLDSDDVFFPRALEVELAAFHEHPEANVVCGTLQYWFSWTTQKRRLDHDFRVGLGVPTNRIYEPPRLLVHNLRAGGRKPGMGCVILRREFIEKFDLFDDNVTFVYEDQVFWTKVSLNATIYLIPESLAKYRQHPSASTATLRNGNNLNANQIGFTTWLSNYLAERKIDDRGIREALQMWRQENSYRTKLRPLFSLYQHFVPWHLRYRIRDLIVSWRTPK